METLERGDKRGDNVSPHWNRTNWLQPLVSIIVTHHNYSDHVADALQSIADQTYENWECVVMDDASDPQHLARLGQILEGFPPERFRLLALEENAGQIPAFFAGLDVTQSEFICLLDPDDRYGPVFLDRMVAAHVNDTVFCPIACCDQKLLKNGAVITGVNSRHKLGFVEGRLSLLKNGAILNIPDSIRNPGLIAGGVLPEAPVDRVLYFPARNRGWPWTSTSSLMFRRAALELLRPHRPLG